VVFNVNRLAKSSFKKMKKYIFFILAVFICSVFFDVITKSFALDEEGCLICHQYPGLVRLEKSKKFRGLHIDESRYSRSAHGKVTCKKCHTTVHQVPHTGETQVDCTTNCHLKADDKIRVQNYPLTGFHQAEQSFIVHLDDETSCRVCHPLYPHSDNNLVRALLNMHTGFVHCEVCHLKKENFPDFSFNWIETENAVFNGKPFGSYYNPKTAKAQKSENFISRIAIFVKDNGKKQLVVNSGDIPRADAYLLKEKELQPDQKTEELNYFHRDLAKKQISVACVECHSARGILNFRQLGFDEKKIKALVTLNIKGLVTKYTTFYFPEMFDQ
jgi:hypothetical protein